MQQTTKEELVGDVMRYAVFETRTKSVLKKVQIRKLIQGKLAANGATKVSAIYADVIRECRIRFRSIFGFKMQELPAAATDANYAKLRAFNKAGGHYAAEAAQLDAVASGDDTDGDDDDEEERRKMKRDLAKAKKKMGAKAAAGKAKAAARFGKGGPKNPDDTGLYVLRGCTDAADNRRHVDNTVWSNLNKMKQEKTKQCHSGLLMAVCSIIWLKGNACDEDDLAKLLRRMNLSIGAGGGVHPLLGDVRTLITKEWPRQMYLTRVKVQSVAQDGSDRWIYRMGPRAHAEFRGVRDVSHFCAAVMGVDAPDEAALSRAEEVAGPRMT
jgi:hypothetical protein